MCITDMRVQPGYDRGLGGRLGVVETSLIADEFLTLSLTERADFCRLMAGEAESLSAAGRSPQLRAAYSDLAKQWSVLADETARLAGRR